MDELTAFRIRDEVVDAGGGALRGGMRRSAPPDRLFHFTDCDGLIKILQSRSLWASLATGLSDDSEVRYGIDRARALLLADKPQTVESSFLRRVVHFLDPAQTFTEAPFEFDVYVVSLCARADRSVHWLHYGRAGTGCAIAFETDHLVQNPFELAPVVYDEASQDQHIGAIVRAVWECLRTHRVDKPSSSGSNLLFEIGAHSAAAHIRMLAPTLKNPAFASEEEWRLITYDLRDHAIQVGGVPLVNRFRVVSGRIVPYLELSVTPLPVTQIVLGASLPMLLEDPALSILLRESVPGRSVEIIRSTVPVRP